jgi:hypothetical protein
MKKLTASLVCLLAFGFASTAIAARPGSVPPEKANILHCGCAVDEAGNLGMAYIDVNVSSKARGHTKHGVIDSCFDGVKDLIEFERTANDCQKDGAPLGGLADCGQQMAGDICGERVEPL